MEPTLNQQLITAFHLENLPAEEVASILEDAGTVVLSSVLTRGIPLLDEEGAAQCDILLENDADNLEIFALLQERVPAFKAIVDEEIELLKKTLA